jgi:cysteine-rich repeat protein
MREPYDSETCDDGNTENGDGCSSIYQIEESWRCLGGSIGSLDICEKVNDFKPSLSNSQSLENDRIQFDLSFTRGVINHRLSLNDSVSNFNVTVLGEADTCALPLFLCHQKMSSCF